MQCILSPFLPRSGKCAFTDSFQRKEFNMQMNNETQNTLYDINWDTVSGPIPIPLTNDYLFHMTLQTNTVALQGLLCSLLHLESSQIVSLEILNPIEFGKSINEKTYILDIRLLFNNNTSINIEMQITNEHNWTDRSLLYLCRAFDNLNAGEDYVTVKSAIQISLLNFTLFPDAPEFYATYRIISKKSVFCSPSRQKTLIAPLFLPRRVQSRSDILLLHECAYYLRRSLQMGVIPHLI